MTQPLVHSLRALVRPKREALRHGLGTHRLGASELSTIMAEAASDGYVQVQISAYLDRAAPALRHVPQSPMRTTLLGLPGDYCNAARPFIIGRAVTG